MIDLIITKKKMYLERLMVQGRIAFYLMGRDGENRYDGKPVVMEKANEAQYAEPTFTLTEDECQEFIDMIWNLGFRPTNQGSKDAFTAQGKHLEDFRKIAFRLLKMDEASTSSATGKAVDR